MENNKNIKAISVNPQFEDLQNPETILSHINKLTNIEVTPHCEILDQLLKKFEPLNFKQLAFPQAEKLENKLDQLQKKLIKSDGSFDSDPAKEHIRSELKNLQTQLKKLKLKRNHFIILSIDNVIEFAKKNKWGLCKNHNIIYLYNGTFWAEINKEMFQKFLGDAALKMGVAKFSAKYFQFRELLFKQFRTAA